MPDRDALERSIRDYDSNLTADLTGSSWYSVDIPAMPIPDNLWIAIGTRAMLKDLIVVTVNPTNGAAKVYFESDLLVDAPMFQNSFWLKLNQALLSPHTKLLVAQQFSGKTFQVLNIELMTEKKKEKHFLNLKIFTAVSIGALFALLAYNLALGVQLKSPLHAIYAVYCLSGMLLAVNNVGLVYETGWLDSSAISPFSERIFVLATYATMTVIFIVMFLESKYRQEFLLKGIALCGVAAWIVPIGAWLIDEHLFLIKVYDGSVVLAILQITVLILWSWRRGSTNAPILLLAFAPLFVFGLLRSFIDQRGWFLSNGIQIGNVFEMLILSWGLTERVRRIRDSALQAKESAERHERETVLILNKNLEKQVTERTKELESKYSELKENRNELQNALEEVSTLKGILPICSYCKNIRDDEGSWEQMESYISSHSDTKFSHGICPDCVVKVRKDSGLDELQ